MSLSNVRVLLILIFDAFLVKVIKTYLKNLAVEARNK